MFPELSIPFAGINDPLACLFHLAGAAWFAWQAQQLIRRAGERRRRAAALAVFALTAVAVLSISAGYHALMRDHPWKGFMQRTDHAAIFLLIAGTLTSFHSVCFSGSGRFWMVMVIWLAAFTALISKLALWESVGDGVSVSMYFGVTLVGMSSVAFLPRTLPWRALVPLLAGVVVYVAGALADLWSPRWFVPGLFGSHETFHLAVLGALLLHWRFFHDWALPAVAASDNAVQSAPALQTVKIKS